MSKSALKVADRPTGRVVHDAKGNSVWRFNEGEDTFRDTQTWVVRQLEVPGLSLAEEKDPVVRYSGDPYNRKPSKR